MQGGVSIHCYLDCSDIHLHTVHRNGKNHSSVSQILSVKMLFVQWHPFNPENPKNQELLFLMSE